MTEESTPVSVTILDREYQVSCPPEETEALRKSAEYLDKQMREIREKATVFGLDRIAVMAALNISNDLLRQAKQIRKYRNAEETQVDALSNKLDVAISRLRARPPKQV